MPLGGGERRVRRRTGGGGGGGRKVKVRRPVVWLRLARRCRWMDRNGPGLGDWNWVEVCVWPARWEVVSGLPEAEPAGGWRNCITRKAAVLRLPVVGTGGRPVKRHAIRTMHTVREPRPPLTLDKPDVSPGRGRRTLAEGTPPNPTPPGFATHCTLLPPHLLHTRAHLFHPPTSSGADFTVPVPS